MPRTITILGSGAAPGVPSLAAGWLDCNPNNPKNRRLRTSIFVNYDGVKILIDTSPDIRDQLMNNNIRHLDAVLYTHAHADHLLGIDYLREINRITRESINFYTSKETIKEIETRFPYIISKGEETKDYKYLPSLIPHACKEGEPFYIKDLKITPINLLDHGAKCFGYIFNDGEFVYISDFKRIDEKNLSFIKKKPEILILPLTILSPQPRHAGLDEVLMYIEKIGAKRVIINHMAGECDFDNINSITPHHVEPAYDNMKIEF